VDLTLSKIIKQRQYHTITDLDRATCSLQYDDPAPPSSRYFPISPYDNSLEIWESRNAKVFRHQNHSTYTMISNVDDLNLMSNRCKDPVKGTRRPVA
jgi:hypothetical protein